MAAKHCLGPAGHSPEQDFHQAMLPEQVALATWPPQATLAPVVLRPVAPGHLRVAVKRSLRLAGHSPERDFHQAILPEEVALAT